MIGSITIKTRPLRLAYLVDPNDASQVREAIRLSSSLWGGTYFPIIPLYKRMPTTWAEKPLKAPSVESVILGYLDAFDPDVLVQLSAAVPQFLTATGRKVIPGASIWQVLNSPRPLVPQCGIGIFESWAMSLKNTSGTNPSIPCRCFCRACAEVSLVLGKCFRRTATEPHADGRCAV